jgi:hypothetical protein
MIIRTASTTRARMLDLIVAITIASIAVWLAS